ncbi:hypothetical protein [Aliamphritea spongicola]|nr:hypothetical protein [Aliamphritea spongicola]
MSQHWVSDKPFDPHATSALSPEQEKFFLASQWKLIWWKFKRHRIAMLSAVFLIITYGVAFSRNSLRRTHWILGIPIKSILPSVSLLV